MRVSWCLRYRNVPNGVVPFELKAAQKEKNRLVIIEFTSPILDDAVADLCPTPYNLKKIYIYIIKLYVSKTMISLSKY